MTIHYQRTGPQAMHQWCFVQSTDPALDPTNQVTAGKAWLNLTFLTLFFRDPTNLSWVPVG